MTLLFVERRPYAAPPPWARDFIMVELVTKTDLNEALERWSLKLSVRLGFMLAAGIAALGVMVKLS
jgi:hypothetical protein